MFPHIISQLASTYPITYVKNVKVRQIPFSLVKSLQLWERKVINLSLKLNIELNNTFLYSSNHRTHR